jgi:hypothetical protein
METIDDQRFTAMRAAGFTNSKENVATRVAIHTEIALGNTGLQLDACRILTDATYYHNVAQLSNIFH